jgi:hypothetical protein
MKGEQPMKRKMCFNLVLTCIFAFALVSAAWSGDFNVLILNGATDGLNKEASFLETRTSVGADTFSFTSIGINFPGKTHPIDGSVELGAEIAAGKINLANFDMIWFTWNGPGHDGDYFMESAETAILKFVESGGLVYMSAFDDNFRNAAGKQIGGWMPIDRYPATVANAGDSELTVTPEGETTGIFTGVNLSGLVLDDNFANTDPAYTVLATRNDNGQPAAIQLNHGAGVYLEVCIDARSTFPAAEPLVENILSYMASLQEAATFVEPAGKLATLWGEMKSR